MTSDHLERGALAGVGGGLAYGLFVATVGNSFTAGLETFEHGHGGGGPVVSELTTTLASVGGGVLWGLLFGVAVFGVGYYLLEPALPGTGATKRLALAGAGFLTVSGAPWLVLPPQPPGVEQALPTETRLAWYGGLMVVGALVAVACGLAYRRTAGRPRVVTAAATLAPLALLAVPVVLAPANPVHGDVPAALVAAYRWTVVFGQALLWATLAAVHAWLGDPATTQVDTDYPATAD
ncbi:CbtA family protein [Halomicroarcula sp. S1AR25-4]|uniref:CbtA family protein n=1 Tax=Haloarcula sp. S1AR25-4 TaxID=2950538 RepID=UPI00287718EE|nr:CbtA family protein [Halomicroarcula sp. S1AR25-4]MDS0278738.1 CbtA family protein [Halomicroarcula sp. S1AR25-4]